MAGFANYRELAAALNDGKAWNSTFRKVPAATATIASQWYDYGYAGGNPIPNYYAAEPLRGAVLEADKGIVVPTMTGGAKQYLHRTTVMSAGATSSTQPLILLDYLLFYPFVDMDAAGETQSIIGSTALPRYTDGLGLQMMVVAQSPTVGGGTFTITYVDADNATQTTPAMFCGAAQPSGALVHAVLATTGLPPFVPLANGRGVKRVVSCNFSVANGGLCAIVIVRPLEVTQTFESCAVAGVGCAIEKEAMRLRGGLVEIKNGAFLGFIGQGVAGSLASSPLVGSIETVWN
jgi:hypothetical protein